MTLYEYRNQMVEPKRQGLFSVVVQKDECLVWIEHSHNNTVEIFLEVHPSIPTLHLVTMSNHPNCLFAADDDGNGTIPTVFKLDNYV